MTCLKLFVHTIDKFDPGVWLTEEENDDRRRTISMKPRHDTGSGEGDVSAVVNELQREYHDANTPDEEHAGAGEGAVLQLDLNAENRILKEEVERLLLLRQIDETARLEAYERERELMEKLTAHNHVEEGKFGSG